jgi:CDP-diglyceride synthetase
VNEARSGYGLTLVLGVLTVNAAFFLALEFPARHPNWINLWLVVVLLYWLFPVPVGLGRSLVLTAWPWGPLLLALVIGAAVLSVLLLFQIGVAWLIAALLIAIVADVAGYFVGRRFGRVKLAPSVSPKKTREGAYGSMLAAACWTMLAAWLLGLTQSFVESLLAALTGTALGALSILGDLWESQLKRQAGVKDSSRLLPGHGGVLDRIDAQLAVLPAVTLLLIALGRLR